MINAVAFGQIINETLPWDKNNPTIWKITGLDSVTVAQLMAEIVVQEVSIDDKVKEGEKPNPENVKVNIHSKISNLEQDIIIVKLGLKGFEKFNHRDGKPVEYKTENKTVFGVTQNFVVDDVIKSIPMQALRWLSSKIWELSGMSEEEEKNSDGQSG